MGGDKKDKEKIGVMIAKWRRECEIEQFELARVLKIPECLVDEWERGKKVPDLEQAVSLIRISKGDKVEEGKIEISLLEDEILKEIIQYTLKKKRICRKYCWMAIISAWGAYLVNGYFVEKASNGFVWWLGDFFLILTIVLACSALGRLYRIFHY